MERNLYKHGLGILAAATFLSLGPPGVAQTQSTQMPSSQTQMNDHDTTRRELASFDQFLDGHREISEQLRKDPTLINNQQFVKNHPALETYLQQHPNVREELTENPTAFMRQENRFERREDRDFDRSGRDRDNDRFARDRDNDRRDVEERREMNGRTTTSGTGNVNSSAGTSAGTSSNNTRTSNTASSNTSASTATAGNSGQSNDMESQEPQDRDRLTRSEKSNFDQFLDSHHEIFEQLRRNPSLANDQQYLQDHPALRSYLQVHPEIQQQFAANPDVFMAREERYDFAQTLKDVNRPDRPEVVQFDRFLDGHREIAEQLRSNPALGRNPQFLQTHPALQSFLQQNPGVRQQFSQDPYPFMQQVEHYDNSADGRALKQADARDLDPGMRQDNDRRDVDNDRRDVDNGRRDIDNDRRDVDNGRRDMDNGQVNRSRNSNFQQVASFDRFLDTHREEAEQLRRNPSLINNQQFLQSHPALQSYLQQNPSVGQAISQDPNAFMREENQFDRREGMDHGRSMEAANFREFLGGHAGISQDLTKDPTKANDANYRRMHPEFQAFLSAHPGVQTALSQNPSTFMKTVQQPATPTTTTGTTGTTGTTKPQTAPTPKPPMR